MDETQANENWLDGILAGYTLAEGPERGGVEWALRRNLEPMVYQLSITGHRLLVAKDRAEEMYRGVIAKPPRTVKDEENQMGSGWVVSVGPLVGDGNSPHPTGVVCSHPTAMLGKHVYFQMYTGKVLRTDESDDEFESKDSLVILTDRDVQGFDV